MASLCPLTPKLSGGYQTSWTPAHRRERSERRKQAFYFIHPSPLQLVVRWHRATRERAHLGFCTGESSDLTKPASLRTFENRSTKRSVFCSGNAAI